ncbi:MAG TPA: cytochrome c [Rhizomicrobium sp.]|jgi:mono/diheme cytochrome c family protein
MIRSCAFVLTAALAASAANAKDAVPAFSGAMPGAGWSAVSVPGDTGEHIFRHYCFECHGPLPDKPGTAALRAKYNGAVPARLDERTDLSTEFVIYTVRHGVSVMPAARKTEITDAELKALADYLARNRK